MNRTECRDLMGSARRAVLGTHGPRHPHLVPIVHAVSGDVIVSAVDQKPKTTRALARLANISANPAVAVLADYYDEDWTGLWWVRADGAARVLAPDEGHRYLDLLVEKYGQYVRERPEGPVVLIEVEQWSGWAASPS